MNRLNTERRVQIVKALVEGNSIRTTGRIAGVAINTVVKLLTDLGAAALEYQDTVMRDLPCKRVQADEIWSFVYAKQQNLPEQLKGELGYGDVWTWTALCSDTKLVPSWMLGGRNAGAAKLFLEDLAGRLRGRIQLTTGGHGACLSASEHASGIDIDYVTLVELYDSDPEQAKRYSSEKSYGDEPKSMQAKPSPRHVSTISTERQGSSMTMGMRRFRRPTGAFSEKLERHMYMVAVHFLFYNFGRPHKSLSKPNPATPAMAAGVADHVWTFEDIIGLLAN